MSLVELNKGNVRKPSEFEEKILELQKTKRELTLEEAALLFKCFAKYYGEDERAAAVACMETSPEIWSEVMFLVERMTRCLGASSPGVVAKAVLGQA